MGMKIKEDRRAIDGFSNMLKVAVANFGELENGERMLGVTLVVSDLMAELKSNVIASEVNDADLKDKQTMIFIKGNKEVEALVSFMEASDDWKEELVDIMRMKEVKKKNEKFDVPEEVYGIANNFAKLTDNHKDRILLSLLRARMKEKSVNTWISEDCDNEFKVMMSCDVVVVDAVKMFIEATSGEKLVKEEMKNGKN